MKIYDISMDIDKDIPVYNNNPEKKPVFKVVKDYSSGSTYYESRVDMEMHTGTHLDAPLHMLQGGGTIDTLDLSKVITGCRVLDLTGIKDSIREQDLAGKSIKAGEFVLFKTRNSFSDKFEFDFVYLEQSGARFLKEIGVAGVGTDALGVERSQPGHETHKLLLEAGIVILEGLRLEEVSEGEYFLFAAPIKLKGTEAAPARAVLIEW